MGGFKIDTAAVRVLAELLEETGLGEIEYEADDRRIRVAKLAPVQAAAVAPALSAAPIANAPAPAAGGDARPAGAVASPMVGTVYLQGAPSDPPFVKPGDQVKEGDILLIIEAMKVMNQIPAPRAGVVRSIEVTNGQAVEFGETLMVIE